MTHKERLRTALEELEHATVSDSFGGNPLEGKAPRFSFRTKIEAFVNNILGDEHPNQLAQNLAQLQRTMDAGVFKYTVSCLGRFSFCIELTNLSITSTKMKTRWVPGRIVKTRPGTFENFEGSFAPGHDERAASFQDCYEILEKATSLLVNSPEHQELIALFSNSSNRGTPYEAVFTYIDPNRNPVHHESNIRLVRRDDALWLARARSIIQPAINVDAEGNNTKCVDKIEVKAFKTDRSQTGEVQTNRAKRWECLAADFQHATIEECWSVQRKLLNDVAHFEGFPAQSRQTLIDSELFGDQEVTVCPITFRPLIFQDLLSGSGHGESNFQVGHMVPLKAGGRHVGTNIEWISNDGNRIQGSLNIEDTRQMLRDIFLQMEQRGLI